MREDFNDLLEHKHVQYTNGKAHEEGEKWQTSTQVAMKRHSSTGNEKVFKPVLTNTFRVHPLEAMDVQKYKKKDLITEMLENRLTELKSEHIEVSIPTPTPITFHT